MYSALVRMQMQLAEQGANQGQVVEAEEGVAEDEELGEDHSIVITQDNIQQVCVCVCVCVCESVCVRVGGYMIVRIHRSWTVLCKCVSCE